MDRVEGWVMDDLWLSGVAIAVCLMILSVAGALVYIA